MASGITRRDISLGMKVRHCLFPTEYGEGTVVAITSTRGSKTMTHDEMIAVLQAAKEGKKIEVADRGGSNWGPTAMEPTWNFATYDYRVRREPRSGTGWKYDQPDAWIYPDSIIPSCNAPMYRLKWEEIVE
jgi:hypothetical protein